VNFRGRGGGNLPYWSFPHSHKVQTSGAELCAPANLKGATHARKQFSFSRKLVVATALALVVSGVAIADDNSTSRFGGDGYAYFNQPMRGNAAVIAAWRQDHPNGLSNRELQAASSSSLAASAFQLDYPSSVFASAPADPSWRQSHPNGLTERELQAASSSSLAVWQLPSGAGVANAQSTIAQASSRATSLTRK